MYIIFTISANILTLKTIQSNHCDAKGLLLSQNGVLFRTCEDGAGWH